MRRIHAFALTVALCLVAPTIVADTTTFRVDSYIPQRFTDLKWYLTGNLNLSGSLGGRTGTDPNGYEYGDDSESGSQQGIGGRSLLDYRRETIPMRFTIYSATRIDAGRSTSHSEDRSSFSDTSMFRNDTSVSDNIATSYAMEQLLVLSASRYLVSDFFLQSRFQGQVRYYSAPRREYDYYYRRRFGCCGTVTEEFRDEHWQNTEDNRHFNGEVSFSAGFGRVYAGQFASHALSVIEVLRDRGLVDHAPSTSEMLQLTEIIYDFRQRHAVDSRIHKIQALREIMTFLQSTGVVREDDRDGYLYLQDVWDYYPRDSRYFGWRVYASAGYTYQDDRYDVTDQSQIHRLVFDRPADTIGTVDTLSYVDSRTHENEAGMHERGQSFAEVALEVFRPLSYRWQFEASYKLRWRWNQYSKRVTHRIFYEPAYQEFEGTSSRTDDDEIAWEARAALSYFFDSRTTGSVLCTANYARYGLPSPFHTAAVVLHLTPRLTYRLALPTEISAYLDGAWYIYDQDAVESDYWSYQLTASINHYLF
jgi:hypothetical protein